MPTSAAQPRRFIGACLAAAVILFGCRPSAETEGALQGGRSPSATMPATRAADLLRQMHASVGVDEFAVNHPVREVACNRRDFGDAGLRCMASISQLERINVAKTAISDAGLANLRDLPVLADLDLHQTPIGDAGMEHIAAVRTLHRLILQGTAVTDAGLSRLRDLPNLEVLDLNGTAVGDASVDVLAGFAKLKQLDVARTRITAAGAASLHKRLPAAEIHYAPATR